MCGREKEIGGQIERLRKKERIERRYVNRMKESVRERKTAGQSLRSIPGKSTPQKTIKLASSSFNDFVFRNIKHEEY